MAQTLRLPIMALSLLALWLLMSGLFKPLLIGFGVISAILCVWISKRLGLLTQNAFFAELGAVRFVQYLFWLTVEIGKADWAITKVILSPDPVYRQRLIRVPSSQSTELGKMIFANSITITPGTVTVETEEKQFIVHSLTDEAADPAGLAAMDRQVCRLEVAGEA